jgi:hypothetical protein
MILMLRKVTLCSTIGKNSKRSQQHLAPSLLDMQILRLQANSGFSKLEPPRQQTKNTT